MTKMDLTLSIHELVNNLMEDKSIKVTSESSLIGENSIIDSMKLVELCLSLEDLADANGFHFDWTSDVALSRSRSMFRTLGHLTAEFQRQMSSTA